MRKWIYMNIKDQGYSLTLVQGLLRNFFSLETARPVEAKFHVAPPWDGETKICSNGPGHVTKMAIMPIYGKNIKNLLLWNQKADDLESWYTALGTRVLPSMFKWWPWLTLTYLKARSNFVPYAFVWEEGKTMDFSETIVVYDIKVGRCSQLNEYIKLYECRRSR